MKLDLSPETLYLLSVSFRANLGEVNKQTVGVGEGGVKDG